MYRNYIYGSTENNSRANTAYYALLKQSITNDATEEEIFYYYDQLYASIMDNREAFKDALLGTDTGKSIVQYYYDVLSNNDALLKDGMTAEDMAVLYAYELYQTEYMSNQIILSCQIKYLQYMLENDTDKYVSPTTGVTVYKTTILE